MIAIGHFIFNTRIGQACAAGVLALVLFGGWLMKHDAKVRGQVYAKIEKTGDVANEKASAAHNAAEQPGAAKRLRDKSCRDCGG